MKDVGVYVLLVIIILYPYTYAHTFLYVFSNLKSFPIYFHKFISIPFL